MLELRALCKTFHDAAGGHWLLADRLDLVVQRGQTVAVLGPSGRKFAKRKDDHESLNCG